MRVDVKEEFERWLSEAGEDNYSTQKTLGIADTLRAHFMIVDFFVEEGSGIGGIGPKDLGLLESALYRQFDVLGFREERDYSYCAATVLYGIINNHPFHDANKRTALLCCLYLLQRAGYVPTISDKELENFTVEIAEKTYQKRSRFKTLRKRNCQNPDVEYIAYFLKKNTRKIDKRKYYVTFRELQGILNGFDFHLDNPNNGHINVVQFKNVKKFPIFGKYEKIKVTICQVGFPSWNANVSKNAIQTIRQKCNLLAVDGVDSQVFFKGLEPLGDLIAKYQEPLRQLADR